MLLFKIKMKKSPFFSPTVRDIRDADVSFQLTQLPCVAIYEQWRSGLSPELWAPLLPTHPRQSTRPVWKNEGPQQPIQVPCQNMGTLPAPRCIEMVDALPPLQYKAVEFCSSSQNRDRLLPPAQQVSNIFSQDNVKINTCSASCTLLNPVEAAQILNSDNNMGKQRRMEMQASEAASKVLRDLAAAWRMELLLAHNKYLTLKKTIFHLKVTFLAGSFPKQHRDTGLSSLFPNGRQIVFQLQKMPLA